MKRIFTICCCLMALSLGMQAQETKKGELSSLNFHEKPYLEKYNFGDNWFISGHVGISHSMSENTRFGNFFKAERPSFQIAAGKMLFPSFGLRLSAGYKPQTGRANDELCDIYPTQFGNYHFDVFAAYLDGMVNLPNVFAHYKEKRKWDLYLFLGLGFNETFRFSDAANRMNEGYGPDADHEIHHNYAINTKKKSYLAAHVGAQFAWHVAKAWDLNIEAAYNGTSDDYNGVTHGKLYDTYVDLMLGAAYHFKNHDGYHRFKYTNTDADHALLDDANRKLADARARLAEAEKPIIEKVEKVKYGEALQTTISFYIDRYYITDAQKKNVASVAKFLENHPEVNLIVTGYADVQTAYPAYNLKLSQRRAKAVYDMLVNDFGVKADRLTIDYKGDTVQPYENVNEWNRAVIFIMNPAYSEAK